MLRSIRNQAAGAARLARGRPAFGSGIRGAIATVGPLLAAHSVGIPEPGLMGLAGFGTAIVDKGGAYRARAATLASFAILGSLSAAIGAYAGATVAGAIAISFVWVALCSLARAWGAAAASVGAMSAVIYVVSLANHATSASAGIERAALIAGGCAWGMLLALFLWPIRLYRPARIAVASSYRGIAAYASDVANATTQDAPPWPSIFQRNHTRMHEELERARTVMASLRRGRAGETGRGERLLVLLEEADQMMTSIVGLADALEANLATGDARAAVARVLAEFAVRASFIAEAIEEESSESSIPPLEIDAPRLGSSPRVQHVSAELKRHIDSATLAVAGINVEQRPQEPEAVLVGVVKRRSVIAPLLDNLNFDSMVFRHALRVGAAAAIATAFTHSLALHRGYWVTISAMAILQPYTDQTFRKGMQRIAGTVVGGIIAAILVATVHDPTLRLVVIFAAAGTSLSLLPLNYGAYAMFTTPTFILLAEMNIVEPHLVRTRILNTLLGGAVAFACARLFWPSREGRAFPRRLAAALEADRRYLGAVLKHLSTSGADTFGDVRTARRSAAVALVNLEASLQRLIVEGTDDDVESLMTMTTYARRMSVMLTALASARNSVRLTPEDVASIEAQIGAGLDALARAKNSTPELASALPLPRAFHRLAEQLAILRRAGERAQRS